jgi:protein tyrosine phosphatase (PTP) superfamily phosphohydrolase (DUF442 family)
MSLLAAAEGIINASNPVPWLLVSGQPDARQFASLREAGVQTVIDIREPMEPHGVDEAGVTAELGIRYINAPVISGALTDSTMDSVLEALRASRGTPTLLHCNSANRTGGPLIACLILDEKMAEPDAVALAMRCGLRSVEVMEWATGYAATHAAG